MDKKRIYLDMLACVELHQGGGRYRVKDMFCSIVGLPRPDIPSSPKAEGTVEFLSELQKTVDTVNRDQDANHDGVFDAVEVIIGSSGPNMTRADAHNPLIPAFRNATGFHGSVGGFPRINGTGAHNAKVPNALVVTDDPEVITKARRDGYTTCSLMEGRFENALSEIRSFLGLEADPEPEPEPAEGQHLEVNDHRIG